MRHLEKKMWATLFFFFFCFSSFPLGHHDDETSFSHFLFLIVHPPYSHRHEIGGEREITMGRKGRMSEEKAAQITDQGREQFSDSQLSSDSCTLQEKVNPSLGTHVLNGICLSHSRAVCLSIKSDKRYVRVGLICITPFMIYPFVYLPSLSPFPLSFLLSFLLHSLATFASTHSSLLSFFFLAFGHSLFYSFASLLFCASHFYTLHPLTHSFFSVVPPLPPDPTKRRTTISCSTILSPA